MRKKALSLLVALTLALCFGTSLAYASPDGEGGGKLGIGTQATGDTYPVKFYLDGTEQTALEQAVVSGNYADDPTSSVAEKEGYKLNGWYTNEACEGTTFDFSTTAIVGNTTLYAKYVPITYKVAFSPNGGNLPAGDVFANGIEVYYDSDVTIPAGEPKRDGYRFLGWFTEATMGDNDTVLSNGKAEVIVEKPNYKSVQDATQTLYAQWQQVWKVTFVSDKSAAEDVPAAQTVDNDGFVKEPAALPGVTGYTTDGKWYKSDEAEWSFDTDKVTAATTLTAKWAANSYTVKFDANAPEGETLALDEATYADIHGAKYDEDITIPADPTLTGYIFKGWATSITPAEDDSLYKYGSANVKNLTAEADGEVTLYAQWSPEEYGVTFDYDGHGTVATNPTVQVAYKNTVTEPAATTVEDEKYDLVGWYTENQFAGNIADRKLKSDAVEYDFSTPVTSGLTLYAVWTPKKFEITFNMNDHGTTPIDPITEIAYGATDTQAPPAPEEKGYTFGGWYTDEGCNTLFSFTDPVKQNVELYAKWTVNTYSIEFNGNAPVGETVELDTTDFAAIADVEYDAETVLPSAKPELTGYTFAGWATAATAADDETLYDAGATVKELSSTDNDTVTLYARWSKKNFTVTFDVQGHGTAPDALKVEYKGTATAPSTDPSDTGYDFGGWFTGTVDNEGKVTLDSSEYDFASAITDNITLYAKWTVKSYNVTFVTDQTGATGPSTAPTHAAVDYKGVVTKPASDPTATANVFKGWYTGTVDSTSGEVTLADKEYDFATPVEADVTLYAKWADAVEVTFVDADDSVLQATSLVEKNTEPKYGNTSDPVKASTTTEVFEFLGWKANSDDQVYPTAELPKVTENTTFKATYDNGTTRFYTIIWKDGNGRDLKTYTQEYDTAITPYSGATPEKDADAEFTYSFADKWNDGSADIASDGNFGNVSQDVTYTAVFTSATNSYPVTFVTNDAVEAPAADTVKYGAYVADPNLIVPETTGYVFDGKWYEDADLTTEYDFGKQYKPDVYNEEGLTLYAGLTKSEAKAAYDEAAATAAEKNEAAAAAKTAAEEAAANAEAAAKTAAADKAAAEEAAKTPGDAAVAAADKAAASAAAAEAAAKASEEAAAAYKTAAAEAAQAAQDVASAAEADNSGVSEEDKAALVEAATAAASASTDAAAAAEAATAAATTAAEATAAAKTAQTNASTAAAEKKAADDKAAADKAAADKAAAEKAAADKKAAEEAAAKKAAEEAAAKKAAEEAAAVTKVAVPKAAKLTYNGKTQTGVKAAKGYTVKNGSAKKAGTYKTTVTLAKGYAWTDGTTAAKTVKFTIAKAAQKIAAKNVKKTFKANAKTKKLAKSKAINLKKVAKVSAKSTVKFKKANKAGGKKIVVNAKTGKITVKKGLKKGTYKVKVKLTAAANANYKAAKAKTIVVTVKVA